MVPSPVLPPSHSLSVLSAPSSLAITQLQTNTLTHNPGIPTLSEPGVGGGWVSTGWAALKHLGPSVISCLQILIYHIPRSQILLRLSTEQAVTEQCHAAFLGSDIHPWTSGSNSTAPAPSSSRHEHLEKCQDSPQTPAPQQVRLGEKATC